MGWTSMGKPYHGDKKRWIEEQFYEHGEEGTNPSYQMTDISIKGREAYGILHIVKADGSKIGFGMVMLLECNADDWAMKEMGEDMMPYYFNAPKGMIKKLNDMYPPVNENSKKWREKCLSN